MGLLSRFFKKEKPTPKIGSIKGSGNYAIDVVGESHYQEALDNICGGKTEDGHKKEVTALVVCEDDNPHDKNAVMVEIHGEKVGYLDRVNAQQYRDQLKSAGLSGLLIECPAIIVGGWYRGENNEGHYGVKLDLPGK